MNKETWLQHSLLCDLGKTLRISVSPLAKWPQVANYFQNCGKDTTMYMSHTVCRAWEPWLTLSFHMVHPPLFPMAVASTQRAILDGLSLWADFIFLTPQGPREDQSCSLLASLIRSKKGHSFWFPGNLPEKSVSVTSGMMGIRTTRLTFSWQETSKYWFPG